MRTGFTVLLFAGLLGACGRPEPAPERGKAEGREETRTIRNTEAIGYAGDAVGDKVDAALEANDQRKDRLDAELDAQP
ncbi:hypothetical protein SAMN04488120_10162 [Fontimonas thermophila]|uniref:Lipoprotein n=1 Tax=Fontimonas thermophila TaxID=1076937 RepID=A0A1I2H0J7_9GAMM|nr:hypothetical protein [Fontimonas thermophila]SFF23048.1 hypothetical protein SAMN04488120_10162 [Fontimonas thermophila]